MPDTLPREAGTEPYQLLAGLSEDLAGNAASSVEQVDEALERDH